ncbi:MAG TPA: thiolase family protein [Pseudolabrys sp.]|nr:thiolase family protein [Pseudolabrys sp.]
MKAFDDSDVVVSVLARTPFGRFNGMLRHCSAPELGAAAIDAVLERAGLPASEIEAAYLGVGMIGAATLTPARQAVLLSRLPNETPSFAVDRACCSGMTAVGLGFKDIRAGEAETVLCGGFESLSRTPLLMPRQRERAIGTTVLDDPLLLRGPAVDKPIAAYTGDEAVRHGVDRGAQDDWAVQSHQRYFAAEAAGYFDFERVTYEAPDGKGGKAIVAKDESPRADTSMEKLAALKPVYGSPTVTPGNAPGLNDGAAALLLMSAGKARATGLPILARIRGYRQVAEGPTSGSYTPAIAIGTLLRRHNLTVEHLDLIEINEAFAATVLVSTLRLAGGDKAAAEKLRARTNPQGGAVAIGHPLGASGARLVMTMINGLRKRGGGLGAAAICGGFGQGDSILIEVRD